jgi:hypothetical protein
MHTTRTTILSLILLLTGTCGFGQVTFELKTSPGIDFVFTSVNEYVTGITRLNALKLNVDSDRRWDMWVKATTSDWAVVESYGVSGDVPQLSVLQLRVRNASSTSLITGFFPITDTEQYIIGSAIGDIDIPCPGAGANVAGNYLLNAACYQFTVDFKIIPGLDPVTYLRPGLYQVEILFTIVEDL